MVSSLVRTDGKQFALGDQRFHFRGVTYGTFRAREDGALFPERETLKSDLVSIAESGFTVLRTYTPPPDDLLDLAADWDLRLLSDVFYVDWRYMIGASRRQLRRVASEARRAVRAEARRLAGEERVFALSLGNEVPADVVRWVGTRQIAGVISELAGVVREEDPERLVTYANYPTTEYLPLDCLDFLTFNVFLEDEHSYRRYLSHLQLLAGDRPLVLGEIGMNAGTDASGEHAQAEALDWQMSIAVERGLAGMCVFSWTDEWVVGGKAVEGWQFGLTAADRSPRPALGVAERWNRQDVEAIREEWPTMSVVICAHNAASTIDECLRHTCALDYPGLEVIVVDDGSSDATSDIARRHPRAKLVRIPRSGLSTARNEGLRAARGAIVTYLDADAFPTPEWPYHIALGFDGRRVGAVGGPNVPPPDDPEGAQVVARSPGGPDHVLTSDDRAEHVPGCNMAFWREVLLEVGGFDPVYTAAGDDVDVCWKVLDKGWEIGFSHAALVWHRRRSGLRSYLRQQLGYGKAEALVEARHPDRFGPLGTATWRGRIYNTLVPPTGRQRIYRGPFGLAPYQSVYQGGGHALDVAHQVGVPAAMTAIATAPLAIAHPALGTASILGVIALGVLTVVDMLHARPPNAARSLRFRAMTAVHHLLQPLVRTWGRRTNGHTAARDLDTSALPGPVRRVGRSVLLFPARGERSEFVGAVMATLRRAGIRVRPASEWEDHDARLAASGLVQGDLITSAHLSGVVQVRVRPSPALRRIAVVAAITVAIATVTPIFGGIALTLTGADLSWGFWRSRHKAVRVLERATL